MTTHFTRREFVGVMTMLAACRPGSGRSARDRLVHVGTYTEGTGRAGLHQFAMDGETGALRSIAAIDVGAEPSFLALHPEREVLYVVNEVTQYEGRPSGAVAAFDVERAGQAPRIGVPRATGGGAPCFVSVDRTGRWVFVANYLGGNIAAFPVAADGSLGNASAVIQHQGTGPKRDRQEGPHAHCIVPDPTNRFVLAADLGADRIFVYRFDAGTGALIPAPAPSFATRQGSGPRHVDFHSNGRWIYVANELDLTLTSLRWDAATGALESVATIPMLPEVPAVASYPADVHVAPSGRHVYASIRGDDSIAVYAIDQSTGAPSFVQRASTRGRWPRNFALDPSGRFLFVANQRSNDIVRFTVDAGSGRLEPTGDRIAVPAPVCIRFGRTV